MSACDARLYQAAKAHLLPERLLLTRKSVYDCLGGCERRDVGVIMPGAKGHGDSKELPARVIRSDGMDPANRKSFAQVALVDGMADVRLFSVRRPKHAEGKGVCGC